eukprot:sb/3464371/
MASAPRVGLPDCIGLLCFIVLGLSVSIIPTIQFISLAVKRYGEDSLDLSLECYHQSKEKRNETCKEMLSKLQDDISSLQFGINLTKGILAPFFVFALGALADVFGQKIPIVFSVFMNLVWAAGIFCCALFSSHVPFWAYIILMGVGLGLAGGSTFVTITFITGYLSILTPVQDQAVRFGTLIGIGMVGVVVGPLISGVVLSAYPTMYYICPLASTGFACINFVLCCFLKPIKPEERPGSVGQALKAQFGNIRDLFKYQSYLPKFLGTIVMYMFCSVGLIAPLVFIPTVYSLGEPFKWTASFRAFFQSGLGITIGLQNIVTMRVLKMFKVGRPGTVRIGIFLAFVATFFLAFATTNMVLIVGKFQLLVITVGGGPAAKISATLFSADEIFEIFGKICSIMFEILEIFVNFDFGRKTQGLFLFQIFEGKFFLSMRFLRKICGFSPKKRKFASKISKIPRFLAKNRKSQKSQLP